MTTEHRPRDDGTRNKEQNIRAPDTTVSASTYADAFADYARTHSEAALYRASMLSQGFVKSGLGPDEIIALHGEAFDRVCEGCSDRERVRLSGDGLQFLLEVMIAYGVQHAEFTELKARKAEQEADHARLLADAAQEADRRKSELMALVAHELRTPLTAALGNVQMARRSLSSGMVERLPRLLDTAEQSLTRLTRLTADLVEASRGLPPALDRRPQELAVLVRQACTWAATVADEKGVRIVRENETWSARVLGDADALLTVFGNLLANAIRYTPEGGTVTVRYGFDERNTWIEIADTGIGMAPDVQRQIFEQFYRAPEAKQIEQQGLGLGLFLVQRLVEAHDGQVIVHSAPGQGSTFRVQIPLLTVQESIQERSHG
jgi:signal transduction histidine kinase